MVGELLLSLRRETLGRLFRFTKPRLEQNPEYSQKWSKDYWLSNDSGVAEVAAGREVIWIKPSEVGNPVLGDVATTSFDHSQPTSSER